MRRRHVRLLKLWSGLPTTWLKVVEPGWSAVMSWMQRKCCTTWGADSSYDNCEVLDFFVTNTLPLQCLKEIEINSTIILRETYKKNYVKMRSGVNKKPRIFIFEYWVFSQKSYLNMGCFEKFIFAYLKFNICIPKIQYLHTSQFSDLFRFLV